MLHEGHKKRLREKALLNIDSLQPHEIIELLLNFGIVRKNTNPIAHELINKFGSVSNVLDADVSALMQIDGVGEASATLLHIIPKLCNVYNKSRVANYSKITNITEAQDYFRILFNSISCEEAYILCLNKIDKVIATIKIGSGDVTKVNIPIEEALTKITQYAPAKVYLAHNHITGGPYPSEADVRFTKNLKNSLDVFHINLIDHIIVCGDECFSFKKSELLK